MHLVDNRNRLPLIPAQLKQYRKLFSVVRKILSRADVAPSRTILQEPNVAQIFLGNKGADALCRIRLNAREPIIRLRQAILRPDLLPNMTPSRTALHCTALHLFFFFFKTRYI